MTDLDPSIDGHYLFKAAEKASDAFFEATINNRTGYDDKDIQSFIKDQGELLSICIKLFIKLKEIEIKTK